jgi:hypothetical protein
VNESVEYSEDEQTEGLDYSVLCRNGSACELLNKDFKNYTDYMEDWEKKLFDEKLRRLQERSYDQYQRRMLLQTRILIQT